nr:vegetative cell wall protein gp1 [Drosophila suzukii]
MFCTESCEHGCNATSSGKLISSGNGNGNGLQPQTNPQQQFNMCYAPLSMQSNNEVGCSKCEVEPPRVGMCLVTEYPEGLSIDCNVPLPNSFNLDEYKNQMFCSSCSQFNGGYLDGFCPPQPGATRSIPTPSHNPNPVQSPACSFQCQCCTIGGACSGYDSLSAPKAPVSPLPKPPATHRPEPPVMTVAHPRPGATVVPPIFCLTGPSSEGGFYQPEHTPVYFCSLIPVPQSWKLVPVAAQSQPLPQQQLMTSPAQDSQLPAQQLVRCDLPFTRLLAELRRDRERFCCELQIPSPLAFQLYAPTVKFLDQPAPSPAKRQAPDPAVATPCDPPPPPSPPPAASCSSSAGLPRTRSASPKRSRSCLRNKDLWASGGATPSHAPYPSAAQHGAGNVCMKCGNCWHCPRCNCSNCFWHPGLGRTIPRDTR